MRMVLGMMVLALAGCSSGSGGTPELTRAEEAALLEEALLNEDVSDPATLPGQGVATYSGFMTARLPTGDGGARRDYLGDLRLAVDFDAPRDQVTGRANGFVAGQDALDGTLRIRGGDLFRDTVVNQNYTFTGLVDGTLTHTSGAYVIDAEINGEFRGRDETGVTGLLFGDVEGPLGQDIFDGDFFAGRDD